MSILGNFSGRKLSPAVFAAVALSLLTSAAHADQFQYQFQINSPVIVTDPSFFVSNYAMGNTNFTLTFDNVDTSALNTSNPGFPQYNNLTGTLVDTDYPFFTVTLTGVTLEVNNTTGNIDFYNSAFTDGLGMTSTSLVGYDLTSDLSIPETFLNQTPTPGSGTPVSSFGIAGGGTFQFEGDGSIPGTAPSGLGFTATDLTPAATPEPSSLLLLGSGLSGLAMLRRRFLKA